jgi:c-di-GMP-binding flagellar brake protein YcgR
MGSTTPQTERRRSKRFSLEALVTIKTRDGAEYKCATRDVSTGGVFFYCDAQIEPGSPIELVMVLPPEITGGEEQWACCHGKIVRVEEEVGRQYGIGVKIDRLSFLPVAATNR